MGEDWHSTSVSISEIRGPHRHRPSGSSFSGQKGLRDNSINRCVCLRRRPRRPRRFNHDIVAARLGIERPPAVVDHVVADAAEAVAVVGTLVDERLIDEGIEGQYRYVIGDEGVECLRESALLGAERGEGETKTGQALVDLGPRTQSWTRSSAPKRPSRLMSSTKLANAPRATRSARQDRA